ncbi:ATP-dependent helicase HrpB [Ammonicoccus fulvus]|uniref:RNA helicase n=1 Tax=Ammonicoccus fulvus TaxID=3138240 RepID=A0ABZ3FWQ2_9ACTN
MADPFDLERIGAGLPVATALGALRTALEESGRAVVQAPPGTGKTTLIPPLLANTAPGRVIVTQPRRVAARAAATRLAALAGVPLGDLVGYRIRGESRVSARTRVEFCTTGILVRRLLAEPDLPGVSAIVLDEVHERQLDSDLAFAMVAEVAGLRDDLRVVAMSATLAADRFAAALGGSAPAPVVDIAATLHDLTVRWAPPPPGVTALGPRGVTDDFLAHVAATTQQALASGTGDGLVFLSGVREVERVAGLLADPVSDIDVLPLHGRLPPREQDRALAVGPRRRVVVATSVAESSLTVPGVRLVVDAGLAREPRFDAARGMTGLVTRTESRSSAEQRAGRAAREGPGTVVRCFAAETWPRLEAAPAPEILTADLTRALLDLACWGAPRGEGLALLDPPPPAAATRAEDTLRELGAIDGTGAVTDLGLRLARVPADPRLARALFLGAESVGVERSAEIVAALESDQRAPGADLGALLRLLRSDRSPGARAWRTESDRLARMLEAERSRGNVAPISGNSAEIGPVVAAAFPDRIARRRQPGSPAYLLSSGTAAELPRDHALGDQEWLAIAEVDRVASGALIRSATHLNEDQALASGAHLITDTDEVTWRGGRVAGVRVRRLGAIELTRTPFRPDAAAGAEAVRAALAAEGLDTLVWSEDATGLRRRMAFAHRHLGTPWPAIDDEALLDRLDEWLGPEILRLAEGTPARSLDLAAALRRLLPWPQAGEFDAMVPQRLEVPTGSKIRIAYPTDPADRPVLAVKLQECFGLTETPRVAGVPILFHLLSPAGRPLAVTDDLASFWVNAYPGVRAENRGRYSKHPWPEDPLTAPARRGTTRSGR